MIVNLILNATNAVHTYTDKRNLAKQMTIDSIKISVLIVDLILKYRQLV